MLKAIRSFFYGPDRPFLAAAPRRSGASASFGSTPRQIQGESRKYYDALSNTRDRTSLPSMYRGIVQGFDRFKLAQVGEWLYENDGLVSYTVDTAANYTVPIRVFSASLDTRWNTEADAYFEEWERRADFTGRYHMDTLQDIACRYASFAGDVGILLTSENGFPQVQLIEANAIKTPKDEAWRKPYGGKWADGVHTSEKGVVLGYAVVYERDDRTEIAQYVPASEMILLSGSEGTGYRSLSPIRRGSNDVRDARDTKGFEKTATKISSALAAVIEDSDGELEDEWGNDSGNGLADGADGAIAGDAAAPSDDSSPATEQEKAISIADLFGGDIITLPKGKSLKQIDNNRPGDRVIEFLEYLGACFVYGQGLPPAFIDDRKLTGPNQRAVNGKAQRHFDKKQSQVAAMMEWIRNRVISWGIDKGDLDAVDGFLKTEWQGPAKLSIDEGRDAAQWREDLGRGLMTRQAHFGNRSLNWKRETDQGISEDDYIIGRCREISDKHKIPIEWILVRWGYVTAQRAPTPAEQDTAGGQDQNQNNSQDENTTKNP